MIDDRDIESETCRAEMIILINVDLKPAIYITSR